MDEFHPSRTGLPPVAPEAAAANIRSYLALHRPGSPGTTLVVVASAGGSDGLEGSESRPDDLAGPTAPFAVDRLRHGLEVKPS